MSSARPAMRCLLPVSLLCLPVGPDSGDVVRAGEVVRVEWEVPQDSTFFDVTLFNDGAPVSLQGLLVYNR